MPLSAVSRTFQRKKLLWEVAELALWRWGSVRLREVAGQGMQWQESEMAVVKIYSAGLTMYINKLILYGSHFKACWRQRDISEAIKSTDGSNYMQIFILEGGCFFEGGLFAFCLGIYIFFCCWTVMNCLIIYSIFLPLAGSECSQIGAKNSFSRALITQRGNA